ncbi:putative ribonuclease H-like domain-containing protein [Tanacetum coccineum]
MEVVSSPMVEVIVNRDSPLQKRTVDGVEQTYPPTTTEEKLARKNDLKARGTLLMALPNEHQLKFNTYKCAKILMEAIEKSSEGLVQTYDRLQKLISQLEILGETISQEDMNLKFLRCLPSEWKTHTLIWRNKPDLDTLSMHDLYNNLKIYETEVKGMSDAIIYSFFANQSNSPQLDNEDLEQIDVDDLEEMDLKWQMAMLTMRAKRFLNKTRRKISANALVAQDELGYDWSGQAKERPTNFALMAYTFSGSLGSSSSDSESQINVGAYKASLESIEARLDVYKKNDVVFEEDIKILKLDIMLRDNALTELRKKFKKAKKEIDDLKLTLEKFEKSSKNLSKLLEIQVSDKFKTGIGYDSQVVDGQVFHSQVNDKYKTGEGYHAVPPPYTRNFMPSKPNLVLANEEEYVFSKSITSVPVVATSKVKTSESKPKSVSEPLIEDWIFDSEDENETKFKSKQRKSGFAKVEFVKSNEHVKIPRESVEKVENNKQAKYPRKNSQSPIGNKRNWNHLMTQKLESNFEFKNKAWYVCGSFNHLIKYCNFYEKKMVEKPILNNDSRVNHQNSQRLTHPHPKGNFVPKVVLMKSGHKTLNTARQTSLKAVVSVNTARPINTAYLRPTVNSAKTISNIFNRAHSHVRRPFNKFTTNKNSNLNEKVNNVRRNVTIDGLKVVVSYNKEHEANVVKVSEKGVIDSGCSWHMTGNKSCLSDYEEIDGGFVAFGGSTKGDKITGKEVDNGTEFKNKVMNQFCEIKGIKREFSIAKTPQQNGLVERKNRTLIEAARTMCPVTILNTIDHLGKFDGKADEGTKACENASKARVEIVPGKDYILLPFLTQDPPFSSSLKDSPYAGFKPSGEEEKKDVEHLENEDSEVTNTEDPNQEQDESVNSTNNINTVNSTINTASIEDNAVDENTVYGCADDPNMPNLEEIIYSEDDGGVGVEADMNNLDTFRPISPILTTRIHKDHPFKQIIGDLHSAPQTRRMAKSVTKHKPKKVIQALKDLSWIEAMQEELLQFKLQQVYRNKKDERGIVIRNKARLVTQGYTQEEGIYYDEVFALVFRIEAIRLFLAYASFKDLVVYQMDVKSAFLYGKIEEEVYKDDGIFISQDKYVDEILKKFVFSTVKTTSTPIETSESLMKDENANVVKASACWVWRPKQKVLDHVSRHNDYEEIDGRFVAFGGDPKGGKITGKGKISIGKLDFEDVYFVKELKFNLFSVSQMCGKKNSVHFTNTECVVLSPDFKLPDENHVLLRVPRKDNMYSVDLKNIVPSGGLTCLFAKATLDESNHWHKRLGHINFKTINKLVKGNLVRGLPSKLFEINQTCVACQKGKQHKDFCIENLIDLKVKVIRCDNKTEFKNKVMNQFYEIKGIKREFSVARTPQQNEVAERKNRTLIEAARTMIADSKLPTTF